MEATPALTQNQAELLGIILAFLTAIANLVAVFRGNPDLPKIVDLATTQAKQVNDRFAQTQVEVESLIASVGRLASRVERRINRLESNVMGKLDRIDRPISQ